MSAIRWVFAASSMALLLASACGDKQGTKPKTGPDKVGQTADERSRCDVKGKRVVKLDLNQDKQPDVWNIYAKRLDATGAKVDVLTCKSIDLNFDGRKDMWKYFDDQGNLIREEMDLDFDGRVDLVTLRRAGKVWRQELDTNYDGKPDIWKYFEEEILVRVDRDSNNDSKVDYWEYYEGGKLDRIGYDKDGDGRVDQWDRAPSPTAAAPAPQQPPAKAPEK